MRLKHLSWLPAFLIMVMIFSFSSKPASISEESSLGISKSILQIYERIQGHTYPDDIRMKKLMNIDHFVRKSAHFTEYALLAIAIGFHLWTRRRNTKMLILLSIGISLIYATTDEFHQLFVQGRSGRIQDVMIDTAGAATGILVFCIIIVTLKRKRPNRS